MVITIGNLFAFDIVLAVGLNGASNMQFVESCSIVGCSLVSICEGTELSILNITISVIR